MCAAVCFNIFDSTSSTGTLVHSTITAVYLGFRRVRGLSPISPVPPAYPLDCLCGGF